ncbi:ETEC_3214 domain-containing protein [Cellulomonas shaoxiangyii]|uniref:Uncharacterized protein n=1 Tax=Cellulomonas shaoxiangyii TaxID=2566013 RepID=A0A4P7SP94_9CELL|nr:ETEC_3214 domain-containing protein [Cellulomonas shaoxiangyii]QCB94794.1 hypothetical protein E5225_15730 [Cellulomonas shaoxiangyii]TGY86524.1 hypothetical protein E5226_01755 [Cellulomonas shaoxiangyii]
MTGTEPAATGSRVHARLQHLQQHPVLAVLLFSAGVIGAVGVVWGALSWGRDRYEDIAHPYAEQYAELERLDLDMRLEYFEDTFGVAKAVVDVCAVSTCPEPPPESLQLVVHETDEVVVRGLFAGNSMAAYLVTTTTDGFEPPVTWIDLDLGRLGTVTTAEVLDAVGAPLDGDASVVRGTAWTAYADVLPGGAPASYRGLVLAWSPQGTGTGYGLEASERLVAAQDASDEAARVAALDDLRATTTPNTYGEFRDDGPLGAWLHDPAVVHDLLFVGSES